MTEAAIYFNEKMKLKNSFPIKVEHNGTFGGYLRFCRILQGFSQEETGKVIARDKVSMSRMERNDYTPPDLEGLVKLADFLGIKQSTQERFDFITYGLASRMSRKGLKLDEMLERDLKKVTKAS